MKGEIRVEVGSLSDKGVTVSTEEPLISTVRGTSWGRRRTNRHTTVSTRAQGRYDTCNLYPEDLR